MKGLQPSGIRRRNKMIYAAVVLFLENGYEKTTTAQIARRAGMSATSFFAAFPNKEAILYALVREMLAEQFSSSSGRSVCWARDRIRCCSTARRRRCRSTSRSCLRSCASCI